MTDPSLYEEKWAEAFDGEMDNEMDVLFDTMEEFSRTAERRERCCARRGSSASCSARLCGSGASSV